MIAWNAARTIAVAMASRTEQRPSAGVFDYPDAVERVITPLSEFTGMKLPPGSRVLHVADRTEWIDSSIKGFGRTLEPILQRAEEGAGDIAWAVSATVLTAQVGFLLGFLSSRVLGQYDTGPLISRTEVEGPGEVFFLDGNVVLAAGRLGVPADALRLWIVLHEMTHAFQFEAHPWLRRYLGDLFEGVLSPLTERLGVREFIRRLADNLSRGGRALELMMSLEQREKFYQMQATMSLIEGYSDYVMHNVGRSLVPGYDHLKQRMQNSRMQRPPLENAIFRITGLDLKLQQYRLGEEFVNAVAMRHGMEGLNRVWEQPAYLPTLPEIEDPSLWLMRMEAA